MLDSAGTLWAASKDVCSWSRSTEAIYCLHENGFHPGTWVALSCCLILLVSLCFSVCLFCGDETLWGSAMPAFSCQYLDKDELLHLAGANKDHIYKNNDFANLYCAPVSQCCLVHFCSIFMLASMIWVSCMAGVQYPRRCKPDSSPACSIWSILSTHISFKIIKVSMKLLNRGLFVTAHGPPTCLGENLPKLWTGM